MFHSQFKNIFKNGFQNEKFPILQSRDSKASDSYGTNNTYAEDIATEKPPKYPVGVYFILASKFFESFAANGVRSILALYLRDSLHFSRDQATILLHIFNFFSQFCPILGAFIADGYIGNERSIFSFMIIYAVGFLGITLTALPLVNQGDALSIVVYLSLWLISVGNGSIRANITSLGAGQFQSPAQAKHLDEYFSRYYFVYTGGILLSKTVTPSIRGMTKCFGQANCYLAVFGVLSVMFLLCFVIFLLGLIFYVKDPPPHTRNRRDNSLFAVVRCVSESLQRKLLCGGQFLENLEDKYDEEFIKSVHSVLEILKLFLPLPIYWALLAQQDSSWTFQAAKLDTLVGGWRLEPDQMKAIAPLLLLAMIPLWDKLLLPAIHRTTDIVITPVASIALGGISAAAAFICSGFLEEIIQQSDTKSISILWQLPQFTLLMIGELLLAIPGIQFAFKEAPSSMKSVITAVWFINNAFGNLIVVLITELKPVAKESLEYFLYAFLMILGILLFMFFAQAFEKRQGNYLHDDRHIQSDDEKL